ncbi:MarR family winged helix-turn-helix transcriptional regulator [Kitasatospora sp. McL0602]|uniref:MarR family winged helix-turn-helix transcriptional regulator n=1 Tax=Kitasatospora sp. McL0602 TaxID=3439530 RepID=UPI003F8B828A
MKPIGYWLNRTDQALTAAMDTELAGSGLTRLGWQVLNAAGGAHPATEADVLTVLAANADPATLAATVRTLAAAGWVHRPQPDQLALTEDGRARLAEVFVRVAAFRELSAVGISPEEYRTAVSVLERMTGNLESAYAGDRHQPLSSLHNQRTPDSVDLRS